jgi:membrane protein YqaA with SNARE-associated domain
MKGGVSGWLLGLFLSPLGAFVMAFLDSTTFFYFPLGIDAVVMILVAKRAAAPWVVPLIATVGSLVGASLTFFIGAKIGDEGLDRYGPKKRLEKIRRRIRRSGAVALAVLDLVPPPFPFTLFVLAAGALDVDATTFFVMLAVCRLVRFGAEAALAVMYGSHIVRWLESDAFREIATVVILVALAATTWSAIRLIRATKPATA